ncbi:type VI secretion system contractile sheath large subunit [Salmonella enterica]|nr:type VI secretion system contractile sheath large subunit [Salmonella enterica]
MENETVAQPQETPDITPEQAPQQAEEAVNQSSLDDIIDRTGAIRREADRDRVKEQLAQFMAEVTEGSLVTSLDLISSIEQRIAAIDALLSAQMSVILHHPAFQKMESSWRALKGLVDKTETDTVKIRLLNADKAGLMRDFKLSADFDQSVLFKCIYEKEYGTFGGLPYSFLIGDFSFDNTPEDLYLLEQISHVAAAAHAPLLSAVAPGMFGLSTYSELPRPRDLARLFETTDYIRWKRFRESDDSRYVGLTLPRTLGRLPYGAKTQPAQSFCFEEVMDEGEEAHYLWQNAAYALGGRMIDAFEKYGWCASVRGVEGGGLVDGLPAHHFTSRSGEQVLQCPTETAVSDRREKELAELGFIPLVYCKGTDCAAFFSLQTANKPRTYTTEMANANARLGVQLQYIMAISRFSHYLKIIARDKLGAFTSRESFEFYLQTWISQFVVVSDNAGAELKARYPLREARVEVIDVPGQSGVYRAIVYLRPHFQLDGLTMSLRLVSELPVASN